MSDFFEAGKTYVEREPYRAPELLEVFKCEAVAKHPKDGTVRALGFRWYQYPGPESAASAALQQRHWDRGNGWLDI